ncbi:hypothetical protein BG004_005690 [Podila humilis]|nr:hypothetical protein BG004_005690 [Podila humilis]
MDSSTVTVSATYSLSTPGGVDNSSSGSETILTFQEPILNANASTKDPSEYLTSLAKALNSLQESINVGLTERLVQQGVLSETNKDEEGQEGGESKKNNKLRTKVPGQHAPKKGLTKKQKQELVMKEKLEKENKVQEEESPKVTVAAVAAVVPQTTSAAMEIDSSSSSTTTPEDAEINNLLPDQGGEEEEEEEEKDEVDLVMEADPGEVDGACLELPKEQDLKQTKKRNGDDAAAFSGDLPDQDLAAKKSRAEN